VEIGWAWEVLGLEPTTKLVDVRKRFRALLFAEHPDRHVGSVDPGPDADGRTRELIASFRVIEASLGPTDPAPNGGVTNGKTTDLFGADMPEPGEVAEPDGSAEPGESVGSAEQVIGVDCAADSMVVVRVLERDTLSIRGPADQVFAWLLEVGATIGEITYLDRQNELFESLLKTVDGDAISLVCTLQGRADETTEAFFTMEPLGLARYPIPDLGDVVELIAQHLRANLTGL
jgi:hypothetical protein